MQSAFGAYVISTDCIRISKPTSPLARSFALVCAQQAGLNEVSRVGRRIVRRYSDRPEGPSFSDRRSESAALRVKLSLTMGGVETASGRLARKHNLSQTDSGRAEVDCNGLETKLESRGPHDLPLQGTFYPKRERDS
jgi:hypothetical protein